jgi:hypothetical protein
MYSDARFEPTRVANCCWVYMVGAWRCIPC